jgi:hypothetical protein
LFHLVGSGGGGGGDSDDASEKRLQYGTTVHVLYWIRAVGYENASADTVYKYSDTMQSCNHVSREKWKRYATLFLESTLSTQDSIEDLGESCD